MFTVPVISFAWPVTIAAWITDLNKVATNSVGIYISRGTSGTKYGWHLQNYQQRMGFGSSAGSMYYEGFNPQSAGWHHWVGTFTGVSASQKLYLDGIDISAGCSQPGTWNIGNPGTDRMLGLCGRDMGDGINERGWICKLGDVVIANRAYGPEWVAAVYAETKGVYL
jgi:hypothetical protein